MNTTNWVLITTESWGGAFAAVQALGAGTTAVVVGPKTLADQVAAAGPAEVLWIEPGEAIPAEAYSAALAAVIASAEPRVLVATSDPSARVLLGAAAVQRGAQVVPRMIGLGLDGAKVLVRRSAVGGETIETLAGDGPVAAIYEGEDVAVAGSGSAPVNRLDLAAASMAVLACDPIGVASGLDDAQRVVSFGRGVRAKQDVDVVRGLAEALEAELACSMPIADDLGWLEKSRYVGRSGNHIKPALYLAVGIAGAAQHLEGVRGAKVIAAINNDPQARIFQTADYGIVGDLYEVIPALIAEVHK